MNVNELIRQDLLGLLSCPPVRPSITRDRRLEQATFELRVKGRLESAYRDGSVRPR